MYREGDSGGGVNDADLPLRSPTSIQLSPVFAPFFQVGNGDRPPDDSALYSQCLVSSFP